jgi:hypothetical protein
MFTFLFSFAAIAVLFAAATYLDTRYKGPLVDAGVLIAAFLRKRETLDGYENAELIDVILRKTKAYDPSGLWPEMAGVSSVLDFGGGCGLHYKLARNQSPNIRWAIVETPAMTERAKELSTESLKFFTSISDAAHWLGSIDMMYSNGALQYTTDPEQTLRQLCSVGAKTMLWQRIALSSEEIQREEQLSRLGDNGPGKLARVDAKTVRYTRTKIPEQTFLATHENYMLSERGPDWFRFSLRSPS